MDKVTSVKGEEGAPSRWTRREFLAACAGVALVACSASEESPVVQGSPDAAFTPEAGPPDAPGVDVVTPPPDPLELAALRHDRHRRDAIEWESGSWPAASDALAFDGAGCDRDCTASLFAHEYG